MSTPFAQPQPWDLVADGYDTYFRATSAQFSRRAIELVEMDERPGRILDVACGPGTTVELLASGRNEIDAVDFSQKMIAQLKDKLRDGRLGDAVVRPQVMDGQHLELPDDTFDAAVSMFGLMFFPDRARGFRELFRVLRPGAKACVSSWLPLSDVPAMQWMFGALSHISPPPPPDAPPRVPVLEDPEVFQAELTSAGFIDIQVLRVDVPLRVGPIEEFWNVLVESSAPVALLRHRLGEAQWAELSRRGRAHLTETAPDDLASLELSAWLGVGRKPG